MRRAIIVVLALLLALTGYSQTVTRKITPKDLEYKVGNFQRPSQVYADSSISRPGFTPINVTAFGVDHTGATDCTDSLQAVVDSVISWGSGEVYMPPGTYVTNTGIMIDGAHDFSIRGENATVRVYGLSTTAFEVDGDSCSNVSLSGLTIIGSADADSSQRGFQVDNTGTVCGLDIFDNYIKDVKIGISINSDGSGNSTDVTIRNNRLENIVGENSGQGYAIHIANDDTTIANIVVRDNYIERAQRHSVYCGKGRGVTISGNHVHEHRYGLSGAGRGAITVNRSADIVISGNIITDSADKSIGIQESYPTHAMHARNILVDGNLISGQTGYENMLLIGDTNPVYFGYVDNVTVSNNMFFSDGAGEDGGTGISFVRVNCGKSIRITDNHMVAEDPLGLTEGVQLYARKDSIAGGTLYSDEYDVTGNTIKIPQGTDATAKRGVRVYTNLCASGARVRIMDNNINAYTNDFYFAASLTNPYVYLRGMSLKGAIGGVDDGYNVKAFGATGDGSTDDTAAIQAAINAAEAAGGGEAFLPAGEYIISAALDIDSDNVTVCGAGIGATIISGNGSEGFDGITIDNVDNCVVRDLTVRRILWAGANEAAGINIAGGIGSLVERCAVDSCDDSGIRLGYRSTSPYTISSRATVRDCIVTSILEGSGIEIIRADSCSVVNNVISDLRAAGHGIRVAGSRDVLASGNHIYINNASCSGINVQGYSGAAADRWSSDVLVDGNVISGYYQSALGTFNMVERTKFTNNILNASTTDQFGIRIYGASPDDEGVRWREIDVSNNTLDGFSKAIYISDDGENVAVRDNVIREYGDYGIIMVEAAGDTIVGVQISGNTITNSIDEGVGIIVTEVAPAKDTYLLWNTIRVEGGTKYITGLDDTIWWTDITAASDTLQTNLMVDY